VSAKILNPLRSTSASRARLSRVLLFYWLGVVAVIILAPFRFSADWLDHTARVLLFIPLGFLYPLTLQGRNPTPFPVFVLGLVVGGLFAAVRPAEIDTITTTIRVIAAGAGAGIGAYLLQLANRRIAKSGRLAGRLSLEIPLVALIYMLLPPLLTASLFAIDDAPFDWLRPIALIPLGLLGARLIAAVYEHHFAPAGVFHRRSIVIVATGWATLGVFPLLLRDPAVGIGVVALVALATFRTASIPVVHFGAAERRVEADTLRKTVPAIVAYFCVVVALPLTAGFDSWHMVIGMSGSQADLSRQLIALLEPITTLALLGYVLAEARGRREKPFWRTAPRIATECAAVALAMEASLGFQPGVGFSVLRVAIAVAASMLGAGIYHSQRERLQSLLIRPMAPVKAPTRVKPRLVMISVGE
jgi:hypothetical protein